MVLKGLLMRERYEGPGSRSYGVALVDQAANGLIAFAISLIFVRSVDPGMFGVYSTAVASTLLILRAQSSLLLIPATVSLPVEPVGGRRGYVDSLQRANWIVSVPVGMACGVLWAVVEKGMRISAIAVAGSFCVFVVGLLVREFRRGMAYADQRPRDALGVTSAYGVLVLAALLILVMTEQVTLGAAFVVMGATSLLSATFYLKGNSRWWRLGGSNIGIGKLRELGARGLWNFAAEIPSWLQAYAFVYLSGLVLGPIATGQLNAARLVVVPLFLITAAWPKVYVPWAVRTIAAGRSREFVRFTAMSIIGVLGLCSLYAACVVAQEDFIVTVVLPASYADGIRPLVHTWLVYGAVMMIRGFLWHALISLQMFRLLLAGSLAGALTAVAGILVFMSQWGMLGALYGSIAGEVAATVVFLGSLIYPLATKIRVSGATRIDPQTTV
jgi:O-antigen/teichoic acid export membrane protein